MYRLLGLKLQRFCQWISFTADRQDWTSGNSFFIYLIHVHFCRLCSVWESTTVWLYSRDRSAVCLTTCVLSEASRATQSDINLKNLKVGPFVTWRNLFTVARTQEAPLLMTFQLQPPLTSTGERALKTCFRSFTLCKLNCTKYQKNTILGFGVWLTEVLIELWESIWNNCWAALWEDEEGEYFLSMTPFTTSY